MVHTLPTRPLRTRHNQTDTVATAATESKAFRVWLRQRREALGLTQAELSMAAGVSISAVSKLEHGIHGPSPRNLAKLAPALRVTHEQIRDAAAGRPVEVSATETGVKHLPADVEARLNVLATRTMQAPADLLRTAVSMLELAYRR